MREPAFCRNDKIVLGHRVRAPYGYQPELFYVFLRYCRGGREYTGLWLKFALPSQLSAGNLRYAAAHDPTFKCRNLWTGEIKWQLTLPTPIYGPVLTADVDGDGKGDLAVSMDLKLNDWRDPSTIEKMTDGQLFYIITNGRGKMVGGEGDRTKEQVRWNLVNLVRSFGKKSGT
jgi:hypothetical protein